MWQGVGGFCSVLQCVALTQRCPESHATEVILEILKSHLCNRFATPIDLELTLKNLCSAAESHAPVGGGGGGGRGGGGRGGGERGGKGGGEMKSVIVEGLQMQAKFLKSQLYNHFSIINSVAS